MAPPKDSILIKYFYPVGFAICGVTSAGVTNYYLRRPFLAGVQRHIVFGIAGAVLGHYFDIYLQKKWMERDAVIKHYIELHPEDFKDERRKYKEIFDAWYPHR